MIRLLRHLILCAALLATAVAAQGAPAPPSEDVTVTEVFDGDTIVVLRGGREVTVRLIGVDTPETGRPETPVQFFGPEATDYTRRTLLGAKVRLQFEPPDRPGGAVDRYGRLLAYVITADGRNVNLELVRRGYGRAYRKYPFTLQAEFAQAEQAARSAGAGIWDKARRAAWSDRSRRGTVIGNVRSRIYHLPGQMGYDRVQEKNRIYFRTEDEARQAGYRKARN